jgi:secreted trypsin-like serine protease
MNPLKKLVLVPASLALLGGVACEPKSGEEFKTNQQAIVGGNEATPGEYPWMVQISTRTGPGNPFVPSCGGSLIAPNWVLTAGHCVTANDGSGVQIAPGNVQVRLGEHTLSLPETPPAQIRNVAQVERHPGFQSSGLTDDLGLLRLTTPVTLNARVQLIRLAVDGDGPGEAWLSGWGATIIGGGDTSNVLKELQTNVVDPNTEVFSDTCNDVAQGVLFRPINSGDICIGNNQGGENFQSGCFGDSGSPLIVKRTPTCSEQIAALSSGHPICVNYNIMARVSTRLDWIRQFVPSISSSNVFEAETMFHSTGGAFPGGWNIWSNGYASFSMPLGGGVQRMIVRAAGQNGNGFPIMQVTVNGAVVFNTTVTSTDFSDHAFSFNAPVGNAEVRVNFTNDFYQPPIDRNLLLDKVTVITGTCPPAPPPPDSLTATFIPGADWGLGYCLTIAATNNASVATTNWFAQFNVGDAQIYNIWNGNFSAFTGAVTVSPTIPGSRTVAPGATDTSIGFCANRGPSGFKPQNIDIFGTGVY